MVVSLDLSLNSHCIGKICCSFCNHPCEFFLTNFLNHFKYPLRALQSGTATQKSSRPACWKCPFEVFYCGTRRNLVAQLPGPMATRKKLWKYAAVLPSAGIPNCLGSTGFTAQVRTRAGIRVSAGLGYWCKFFYLNAKKALDI